MGSFDIDLTPEQFAALECMAVARGLTLEELVEVAILDSRTEHITARHASDSMQCTAEVCERFTLRMDLPDGRVIRHDGKDLWMTNGASWHGSAPPEWDAAKAVEDVRARFYEVDLDFS